MDSEQWSVKELSDRASALLKQSCLCSCQLERSILPAASAPFSKCLWLGYLSFDTSSVVSSFFAPMTWLVTVQRRRQSRLGKVNGTGEVVLPEEPRAGAREGDDEDSDGYGEEGLSWEAVLATVQVGQVQSCTDIHSYYLFYLLLAFKMKDPGVLSEQSHPTYNIIYFYSNLSRPSEAFQGLRSVYCQVGGRYPQPNFASVVQANENEGTEQ